MVHSPVAVRRGAARLGRPTGDGMTSLLPGGRLGRYQVIEQIGRGGMATVFRALDPSLKRDVAIKVLPSYMSEDPSFVDRFSHEAQAVAGLVHPNIIRVYDFGEDKGFSFIVMEHVTGGTLVDRLDQPLEISEALGFTRPLGEALQYAHGQGVIHRDIKPSNVLLDEAGRPILADFGLARMLEGSAYLTQGGEVLGTAEYMAPEQALGRQADQRSDMYSLGIVVYQMVVGHTPFKADTPSATLMAHIHQPVPRPEGLDPAVAPRLEPVLMRALAKEADDRFQSPLELTEALESVLTDSPVAVAEPPPSPELAISELPTEARDFKAPTDGEISRPSGRRLLLSAAAAAALVGLLVIAGVIVLMQDSGVEAPEALSGRDLVETVPTPAAPAPAITLPEVQPTTADADPITVVNNFVGALNSNDFDGLAAIYADDIVFTMELGPGGAVTTLRGKETVLDSDREAAADGRQLFFAKTTVEGSTATGDVSMTSGSAPPLTGTAEIVVEGGLIASFYVTVDSESFAQALSDTSAAMETVTRYVEAYNEGDLEVLGELYANDSVFIWGPLIGQNPPNVRTGKAAGLESDRESIADRGRIVLDDFLFRGGRVTANFEYTDDTVPMITGAIEFEVLQGKITALRIMPDADSQQRFEESLGSDPSPGVSQEVADLVKTIFQRASAIRELEPLQELVLEFVPRQKLDELVVRESVAPRERVLKDQALFEVLGLIPPGLDLYQLELDILAESSQSGAGRAALFDSETGTFYVASDLADPTPFQEVEVAAEYSRALLHQHYDIGARLSSLDGEEKNTLDTLVLGDATLTGLQYMSTHVTPQRLVDLSTPAAMPVLDAAPDFLKQRGFSIQAGVNFISALSRSGQRSELRLVYANPPASAEQLLHTEKYLSGEAPVEVSLSDLSSVLGSGWAEIYRGVMGEALVRDYLSQLDEESSISAAEGWGGDRFSLLQGPDGVMALVARFAWDSVEDAREFYSVLESRPPGPSDIGIVGIEVLLVIGPDDGAVARLKDQFPGF